MPEDILDVESTGAVLDEVLQQSSAQALRLGHLDESIAEVKRALADLLTRPASSGGDAHAIEHLEQEVKSLKGKLGAVLAVCVLQLLTSGVLILFAFKPMPAQSYPEPAPAPVAVPAAPPKQETVNSDNLLQQQQAPAAKEEPVAAPAASKKKKKK